MHDKQLLPGSDPQHVVIQHDLWRSCLLEPVSVSFDVQSVHMKWRAQCAAWMHMYMIAKIATSIFQPFCAHKLTCSGHHQ